VNAPQGTERIPDSGKAVIPLGQITREQADAVVRRLVTERPDVPKVPVAAFSSTI
jgi:hypothetical protein